MSGQLNNLIQRQHIEKALKYIANHGRSTNNDKEIYYMERRDMVNPHRCTPFGWATRYKDDKKWIGMKETIRVAYLYAIGVKPRTRFSDKELRKVEKHGPIWSKARKIQEDLGFQCKDMRIRKKS